MLNLRLPSTSSPFSAQQPMPFVAIPDAVKTADILVESGPLTVRLARSKKDIKAAQALRYRIFYKSMGAHPKFRHRLMQVDSDRYDALCDHLLLTTREKVNKAPKKTRLDTGETVVGCYRLLRRSVAECHGGFYTQNEFDLRPFLSGLGRDLNILELGRSCVHPEFRSGAAISLMWRGLGHLVTREGIDLMLGCASFSGTDPAACAQPLSYLYHRHLAQGPWQIQAHDAHYVEMEMMAADDVDDATARRALPPVLRGYIRSGALIGKGAVIDHQFNTVDVLVLMPMQHLSKRYREKYAGV
jgi:putative hemolysin